MSFSPPFLSEEKKAVIATPPPPELLKAAASFFQTANLMDLPSFPQIKAEDEEEEDLSLEPEIWMGEPKEKRGRKTHFDD